MLKENSLRSGLCSGQNDYPEDTHDERTYASQWEIAEQKSAPSVGLNSRELLFTAQQTQKSCNGVLSPLLLRHSRSSPSTTTCVSVSRARTTWSASRCCASTARPPSSPRPPSSSDPSIPSRACAAAARWASRAITARRRSTCATPTPAWMEACAPAKKEGTPASAVKTTRVSFELRCVNVS